MIYRVSGGPTLLCTAINRNAENPIELGTDFITFFYVTENFFLLSIQ